MKKISFHAALVVLFSAFYAFLAYRYGPSTFEEYIDGTFYVTKRAIMGLLRTGSLSYWDPNWNFGVPDSHPAGLAFHPGAWLIPFTSLRPAFAFFVLSNLLLLGYGGIRLLDALRIRSRETSILFLSALYGSLATLDYALHNTIPTGLVNWTCLPLMAAMFLGFLETKPRRERLRDFTGNALLIGFFIANSNPSIAFPTVVGFAIFAIGVAIARKGVRGAGIPLLVYGASSLLGGLVAIDKYLGLLEELKYLATDVTRSGVSYTFDTAFLWHVLFRPLCMLPGCTGLFDQRWEVFSPYPGIGFGLQILVFSAPIWLYALYRLKDSRFRFALALTFAYFVGLKLITINPRRLGTLPGGNSSFRDILSLLGITLSVYLFAWLRPRSKHLFPVLLGVQLISLGLLFAPYAKRMAIPDRLTWDQYEWSDEDLQTIRDWEKNPGRTAFTNFESRTNLSNSRLLPEGIPVLGGSTKGVSLDVFSPSVLRFYGEIPVVPDLTRSLDLLRFVNVRRVLTTGHSIPPPISTFPQSRPFPRTPSFESTLIYEIPDSFPLAFTLPRSSIPETLPLLPGCKHDRLICRDFSFSQSIHPQIHEADSSWTGQQWRISLPIPAGNAETLILTQMFRPQWRAISSQGGNLRVFPLFGAFIGVELPPGTKSLSLEYRPIARSRMRWVSGFLFLLLAVTWFRLRERTEPSTI